jgi:DNA-binding response OmpR family regulator
MGGWEMGERFNLLETLFQELKELRRERMSSIKQINDGIKLLVNSVRGGILIVDDDQGLCEYLKRLLTEKGYNVGIASTGEEAIALASRTSFDMYLLDLKLPTADGLVVYQAIRKLDPDATIFMISGHADALEELARQHLEGVEGYLVKSLDLIEMLKEAKLF